MTRSFSPDPAAVIDELQRHLANDKPLIDELFTELTSCNPHLTFAIDRAELPPIKPMAPLHALTRSPVSSTHPTAFFRI